MATDPTTPRSRRAILAAAAGSAAAAAATAILPSSVAAVSIPMVTETANATTAETSVGDTGDRTSAWKVTNVGVAPSVLVANAAGVPTNPNETDSTDPGGITGAAGVYATSDDATNSRPFWETSFTGVYGWAPASTVPNSFATGLWGDSEEVGTYGSGDVGVRGDGFIGVVASGQTGGGVGLLAWGGVGTGLDTALDVRGKVKFSRSGRSTIAAGKSSIRVTLLGTSTSSRVFAVLHSNRSGRYVRAVVPTTGSFTIYLNTTVTAATYVAWFVIN